MASPQVKRPGPGSTIPVGTGIDDTFQCAPPSVVTMSSAIWLADEPEPEPDGALSMTAHMAAVAQENLKGRPSPPGPNGMGAVSCQLSPPLVVR